MSTTNTLADQLTVFTDTGSLEVYDLPVTVYLFYNGGAAIWVGRDLSGTQVRVALTPAERISLIEALGGKA